MKNVMKAGIVSAALLVTLTGCFGADKPVADAGSAENAGRLSASWIASKNTTRINADHPAEAAAIVSQTLWMATKDSNRPGGVIIADPKDWQTALVSANLIHHPNDGPVLFANKDSVPDVTLQELKRLRPKGVEGNDGIQVMLVGNLDEQVEVQIKALGYKTDRIAGINAPAIAKAVDAYYADLTKELPQSVIVGSMDSAEYTMPAVNWIAHMPEPLLYVRKDEIPQETIEALSARGGQANIYILGPEAAVSAKVEEQLGQYGKVVRIAGDDPYENAVAFAKYKDAETGFGWGIDSPGHNFSFVPKASPELALAAAPFSHLGKHAPLLWTDKKGMPDSVMAYVMSVQPKYKNSPVEGPYNHAWLTGSTDELSEAAQGEIDAMLEIVSESGAGHGAHGGGTADGEQSSSGEDENEGGGGSSHH
ncbi:cell wall-binding repeat-containing protein [Paenibacillus sp. 1011MAR3C5]|uniref:cell wall-binding repeat-containing protein n=1 Tax=Paenibacillus sp. 1011MAR3C5 TaxID=1675787 RepID=UPI000E6CE26C|nr:cell wall-binding repeat-containing protein [Paenibacillus sp. 1011MAR3C5]RJE86196.1 cell wall-binding repeat-containing protein [Paenibacillus sp. 1011MAR3C5]